MIMKFSTKKKFCRLCVCDLTSEYSIYLYGKNMELADQLNACLPITVSKKDSLPKQICSECWNNFKTYENFFFQVVFADEKLKRTQRHLYQCVKLKHEKNCVDCPLCAKGHMKVVQGVVALNAQGLRDVTIMGDIEDDELFEMISKELTEDSAKYLENRRLKNLKQRDEDNHDSSLQTPPTKAIDDQIPTNSPPANITETPTDNSTVATKISSKTISEDNVLWLPTETNLLPRSSLPVLSDKYMDDLPPIADFSLDDISITTELPVIDPSNIFSQLEIEDSVSGFSECPTLDPIPVVTNLEQVPRFTPNISESTPQVDSLSNNSKSAPSKVISTPFLSASSNTINTLPESSAHNLLNPKPAQDLIGSSHSESTDTIPTSGPVEPTVNYYYCIDCGEQLCAENEIPDHECHKVRKEFSIPSKPPKNETTDNNEVCVCHICGKIFKTKSHLNYHLQAVHPKVLYECEYCSRKFVLPYMLKVHHRIHTGEKPYACMECNEQYSSKSHLAYHRRTKHKEKQLKYKCELCEKNSFYSKQDLGNHIRTHHTGERKFHCEICDKRFLTSDSFYRHRNIHKIEKNFVCPVCSKAFKRKKGLKNHSVVHSEERPFSCETCGRKFKRKKDLNAHATVHVEDASDSDD